uniref:Tetrapyrrole methylase domain-containing protein n=1 Tax=Calcidiscus leptoporus TaxID=127549 RepID=A0A7S0NY68_9EUKA
MVPVPGACAAVAALCVSGFAITDFCFCGFLPRSPKARRRKVAEVVAEPRAVVLYESPQRIYSTLQALVDAGAAARSCLVARELTKLHEQLCRGSVQQLCERFGEVEAVTRGEITIVLSPISQEELQARADILRENRERDAMQLLKERLMAGESVSNAAKQVAAQLDVSRSNMYAMALRLRQGSHHEEDL